MASSFLLSHGCIFYFSRIVICILLRYLHFSFLLTIFSPSQVTIPTTLFFLSFFLQEHENRFTFLMGMYLAYISLFCSDSPLGAIGRHFPGVGFAIVFIWGVILCVWNRASVCNAHFVSPIHATSVDFGEE